MLHSYIYLTGLLLLAVFPASIVDSCSCSIPFSSRAQKITANEADSIQIDTRQRIFETVHIPAGDFLMGSVAVFAYKLDGEGPIRSVWVSGFDIFPTEVTNEQFLQFVTATNYATDAERYGWSYVFDMFTNDQHEDASLLNNDAQWWAIVLHADWRHPEGPSSSISDRMFHPVVHVV